MKGSWRRGSTALGQVGVTKPILHWCQLLLPLLFIRLLTWSSSSISSLQSLLPATGKETACWFNVPTAGAVAELHIVLLNVNDLVAGMRACAAALFTGRKFPLKYLSHAWERG